LDEETLLKLDQLYKTKLGVGPFPTAQTGKVGQGKDRDDFHAYLTMYLAGIAGIASHGKRLKRISLERRREFQSLSELPFFDKYPQFEYIQKRIQSSHVPELKRLLDATEEARLLIVKALAGDLEGK
jgi:hypothetical protein